MMRHHIHTGAPSYRSLGAPSMTQQYRGIRGPQRQVFVAGVVHGWESTNTTRTSFLP